MKLAYILVAAFFVVLNYCDNVTILCDGNRFRHNA